jgi:hypothetical protein
VAGWLSIRTAPDDRTSVAGAGGIGATLGCGLVPVES